MIRGYDNIIMTEGICIHQALEKKLAGGEDDDDDVLMKNGSSCQIKIALNSVASLSAHEMKHVTAAAQWQCPGEVERKMID